MAQYHRLAVVNILSFKSFISERCPLFLELLSFKSFEAECDACVCSFILTPNPKGGGLII